MTTLHEAAQKALALEWMEALDHQAGCKSGHTKNTGEGVVFNEIWPEKCDCGRNAALASMRSALAQQGKQQPVGVVDGMMRVWLFDGKTLNNGDKVYAAAAPAAQPDTNHLQDIAACIGVGGYNGATDEQLAKRICDEFLRLTLPAPQAQQESLEFESALYELVDKICPGLDTGNLLDDARTASEVLTSQEGCWTPVTAKLPEWAARDDFPCFIGGKAVNATLTSGKVLVTIAPNDAVRIDNLVAIEGGPSWWDNYGERVLAWMPLPAAYGVGGKQIAAPAPHPDTRTVVQQMVDALGHGVLEMNAAGLARPCMPLHDARKAGQKLLKVLP